MRGALFLPGVQGFEFLEDLLGRAHAVRSFRLAWGMGMGLRAGRWVAGFRLVEGAGVVLRPWAGVLRRGLNAVDGLGGFGAACGWTSEDEFLRGAVMGSSNQQVVEAEAGEQLGENFAGLTGSVGAEDAVIAGSTLDFHAGLGGDGLKDLQQLGVVGFDGEYAVLESDGGGDGRLVGERNRGRRSGGFLRNGRGGFGGLRGASRGHTEHTRAEHTARRDDAARGDASA